MLFNSIEFAIFLPIVFLLYWFVFQKNLKLQNLLIVASSFVFYGWWDWRFLFLMVASASVDYVVGILLATENDAKKRKLLLSMSIVVNLGILAFFKYFNFFVDNFVAAFSLFGAKLNPITLKIVLPVGISFYTFQALSYTIDVYRKKLEPTKSFINYFAFISFFPQLVAGPIERATNLLPQFYTKRTFDYANAVNGMRQILWGLVKKIVIADNAAKVVADVFSNYENLNGSMLVIGAVFFAFQIYGDFSGYSDIAIGTSRLFGFSLMKNFAFPYFSRDIAEFWRRWHISLSTWFRDYLYIPLGGSKGGTWMKVRNTFAIFIVSGFWHGANWTFMIWGALNAIYFLPLLLAKKNRTNLEIVAKGKYLPNLKEIFQIGLTFFLTIIAWVFFRAANVTEAVHFLQQMFSLSLFSMPNYLPSKTMIYILLFVIAEWLGRDKEYALEQLKMPRFARWGLYYLLIFAILWFGGEQQEFIYFQF